MKRKQRYDVIINLSNELAFSSSNCKKKFPATSEFFLILLLQRINLMLEFP